MTICLCWFLKLLSDHDLQKVFKVYFPVQRKISLFYFSSGISLFHSNYRKLNFQFLFIPAFPTSFSTSLSYLLLVLPSPYSLFYLHLQLHFIITVSYLLPPSPTSLSYLQLLPPILTSFFYILFLHPSPTSSSYLYLLHHTPTSFSNLFLLI